MDDNYNSKNKKDEVVDEVPVNAQKIDSSTESKASYTYVKVSSKGETPLSAIISLMLGIFSIICCWTIIPPAISAVVGFVLGVISLLKKGTNKTCAVIGIILCITGILIFITYMAIIVLFGSITSIIQSPVTMQWGAM